MARKDEDTFEAGDRAPAGAEDGRAPAASGRRRDDGQRRCPTGRQGPDLDDEIGRAARPAAPRRRSGARAGRSRSAAAPCAASSGWSPRSALVVALVLGPGGRLLARPAEPVRLEAPPTAAARRCSSRAGHEPVRRRRGQLPGHRRRAERPQYIPDFLINERILFIAAGSVEAYVDFSTIGQGAVKESADHKTVEISLPAPQLDEPASTTTRVTSTRRSAALLNRFGDVFNYDPNRLQQIYQPAEHKIAAAAKDGGLAKRAEDNTRKMLEQFLSALGYTTITVKFPSP